MSCCQNCIKKVLLTGLGGVGTVYANLINKNKNIEFKVLADKTRLEKYKKEPRLLNGEPCEFEFITPEDEFKPDLVIISTKSTGLCDAIKNLKNFIDKKTIIMSFINGISSERILQEYFNPEQILYSYIICHTITRNGNNVLHDGVTTVVWGDKNNDMSKTVVIKKFFEETKIDNKLSKNILNSLWEKFCFNCCVNQISAVTGFNFEQIWNSQECLSLIKNISNEINQIALKEGLTGIDLVKSSLENLYKMIPEGKTSMLQDIENNRTPETDLFGAEVLRLAEKHKLTVPYNKNLYYDVLNMTKN